MPTAPTSSDLTAEHGPVRDGTGQSLARASNDVRARTGTRRRSWDGLAIAVASAATFGTSGTLGTSLLDAGWTPGAAVLTRIGLACLMLTGPALFTLRGRWGQLRRSAGPTVAYGLMGVAGCQVCYFNAIERMPVGVALLIEYLGSV